MPQSPVERACRITPHRLRDAARVLRAGGVIAHATEGVWGLTCDAFNLDAVMRILALKQRDAGRGLIVVAHNAEILAPFVDPDAEAAWRRARATWPGPTTWLLPADAAAPWWLTGAHETIALRQSAHPETAALAATLGGALVSTSANVSGRPPVRSAWGARALFGNNIDFIAGGVCDRPGVPSTIRDAINDTRIRG